MTFNDIATLVSQKVGETDDYSVARFLDFVKNRHREIYESFDWTASQDVITQPVTAATASLDVANADKVISARFNGAFIDPVTPSFVFESHPDLIDSQGTPIYYWSHYDSETHALSVNLYPAPSADGTLSLLVKKSFDDQATQSLLPDIEPILIAYTLADAWEYLRQLGKYQVKIQEAQALLQAAQQRDNPAAPKPRTSKSLTSTGSTLSELTDSVCDIVGRWEPDIRESIKERIRRNYQLLWDMQLWPESIIIANCPIAPDQQQVVLPYLFDRVIGVRTMKEGPLTNVVNLQNAEISWYFGVAYNIFEEAGQPVYYSMLTSVAVATLPPQSEPLQVRSDAATIVVPNQAQPVPVPYQVNSPDAGKGVFIKGEANGLEVSETVILPAAIDPGVLRRNGDNLPWVTSINRYDTPLTISKPVTTGTVVVRGATSQQELLRLGPGETERKHLRIWLLPNQGVVNQTDTLAQAVADAGRVLVCGKRQVSPLLDDSDSPQLRNCNNILINAAAADILFRLEKPDLANQLSQKAQEQMKVLTTAETAHNAYTPMVVPYAENYARRGYLATIP